MGRLQLAIDVGDLDEAIDFYSKLFSTPPAKVKEGYANFAISDPPLKLVLFENTEGGGTINHLGVEAETTEEVAAAGARLVDSDLDTTGMEDTMCCYAEKTETWVNGPDGVRWEFYVKHGDSEQFENLVVAESTPDCCS
ncbi:MAG: ArsI/CadI family heavy metal resistance metalloenzyme [Actinomycetota bacterium]|nr:ArsI/CadI family heavy metal resistance metalloenzyme [Actinomycetota bacterium]